MTINASSVAEYISQLPEDRKEPMLKLLAVIRKNIPKGFEEGINYNMIGFYVPFSTYPAGYHCDPSQPVPFLNLASQKNFIALYHMGLYGMSELHDWFVAEYPKHSKTKLDMGKSCIRFKKPENIPYELIGELMKRVTAKQWLEHYTLHIEKRA